VGGDTACIDIARCSWALRGQRPRARTQAPCPGTGRSHVWPIKRSALWNPREYDSNEGAWEVRRSNSTGGASEQGLWCASVCGGSGGKGLAEGNLFQQPRVRTQSQSDLQNALRRIRQAARRDRHLRFTALWHQVYDVGRLHKAYYSLKRKATPGVGGQHRK
jgi:hypothetical protein